MSWFQTVINLISLAFFVNHLPHLLESKSQYRHTAMSYVAFLAKEQSKWDIKFSGKLFERGKLLHYQE